MQDDISSTEVPKTRPWIGLNTTYDVEAWIDSFNRDLQHFVKNGQTSGAGICFGLTQGGDIYLHTTSDGDVVLDVTPDAQWVTPLITASTRTAPPVSQIWHLPSHTLTQLVLGLNSLIASTTIVIQHDFRIKKY